MLQRKNKLLWFTITPCSASEILNPLNYGGGWLSSIEKEIQKNNEFELNIAFYYSKKIEPFTYKKTNYFPIYRENEKNKFFRLLKRFGILKDSHKEIQNKLFAIISEVKPDLIHIHGTEENYGLIIKDSLTPIILSIQGLLSSITDLYFNGIPYNIAKKNEYFIKKILFTSIISRFKYLDMCKNREIEFISQCRFIMGRTHYDKNIVTALNSKCNYLHCDEILREEFYTNKWEMTSFNKTFKIITVLSDNNYKGFEMVIKSSKTLIKSNFDFEWNIVGLNEKSSVVNITKKWLKCNTKELNIRLLGSKNENEIIELFKYTDLYCHVSHIENSSNSICEAMIIGMPIIASNVGGTSSLLIDKFDGLLFQDGDSYSLASSIINLSRDFNKAKEFGSLARISALKRHDKNKIYSEISGYYRKLIQDNE